MAAAAQAAEPISPTFTLSPVEPAPLFSLVGLKERLFKLRDATLVAIAPLHSNADGSISYDQFDAQHQLFKPLVQNLHEQRMIEKQPDGLQLRSNLLFQYELVRYQSFNPNAQLGVRVGLHYQFR